MNLKKNELTEKRKKYYIENKEKILEQARKRYHLKKNELTKKRKKYYIENKEKILEQARKRYHLNKNEFRKYYREYQKENKRKKFNWVNIKLGNIHPTHFDEKTMFTFKDKVYIEKIKKEDYYNELANKAEQKKYGRFN